jgi:hypothetical protein
VNEGKKTGIFWIAALLMLGVGGLVAYQPGGNQNDTEMPINEPLFADFKDPLAAATMKIVTFDEGQGTLGTFEIRKDRETGNWTIPSRDGYPADAVEQMKNAANALVDLRVLDTIVAEPADHEDFGVVEPNLEALNVGDEGVGRLVTFKDADQKTLASMIIGDPVKEQEGQIYVRKPNQDLVYVVPLDDTPLTTKFQDWIEADLLKISSIDIEEMVVKDYNTNVNPLSGQVALTRNFDATLGLDGADWKLEELKEFDPENPFAEPKIIEVAADQKLNTTQLNEIKNALDDVKITDVVRKPEGMSANLKADQELAADNKARQSLARHGFYPVSLTAGGDTEILSANGELVVGLNDGVEYVLRFGNISGLSEDEDQDDAEGAKPASAGVNRYLLVTTRVNDEKFPPPALKPIPQTIEELEAMRKEAEQPATEKPAAEPSTESPEKETPAEEPAKEATEESSQPPAEQPAASEQEPPAKEDSTDKAEPEAETEKSATDSDPKSSEESGEGEASGSGEGSGSANGQDPPAESAADDQTTDEAAADDAQKTEAESDTEAETEPAGKDAAQQEDAPKQEDVPKSDADTAGGDQPAEPAADGDKKAAAESEPAAAPEVEMTAEEKQELLESEQEKITKENQRALDERKDKLEAAKRRVRDLNARFADWYYVIPEDTYSKLRISRDDLFQQDAPADAAIPGAPGNPTQRFPLPNLTPPGN